MVSAPVLAPGGQSKEVSMFVDPGSNLNFILKSLASELELQGTPTEIQPRVVDDEFRQRPVMIYRMAVVDRGGIQHVLKAVV